jgi:hypothetical protein
MNFELEKFMMTLYIGYLEVNLDGSRLPSALLEQQHAPCCAVAAAVQTNRQQCCVVIGDAFNVAYRSSWTFPLEGT